jgi:hypothetical protein
MTYRELLAQLQALSPEHLDTEIQYQDTNDGELYAVLGLGKMGDYEEGDDPDAPILQIVQ